MTPIPLFTSRWQAVWRAERTHGLENLDLMPVRISRGKPRFWPEAKNLPYVEVLAPVPAEFKIGNRDRFTRHYRDRLDGVGLKVVEAELRGIFESYSRPLVLLCYEDVPPSGPDWCHRQVFGEWWKDQTGFGVPELDIDALPEVQGV